MSASAEGPGADRSSPPPAEQPPAAPVGGTASPTPPTTSEESYSLKALLWLAALDILAGLWFTIHVSAWKTIAASGAGLVGIVGLWQLLPERATNKYAVWLAEWLSNDKVIRRSKISFGGFAAFTLLFSTLRVQLADGANETVRFRIDAPSLGNSRRTLVDDVKLGSGVPEFSTLRMTVPPWRRFAISSSTGWRTKTERLWPWAPRTFIYRNSFDRQFVLSLLLTPQLTDLFGGNRKVALLIERLADHAVLVTDSLRSIRPVVVAFDSVPEPLDSTQIRWRRSALAYYRGDSERVAAMEPTWAAYRWLESTAPLKQADLLLVTLTSRDGKALAVDTISIKDMFTDVIIPRQR